MSFKQIQVFTTDLQLGMYVARLDRPWLETSYKVQGFLIKTLKDIDRLRKYCDYVFIDTEKSSHFQAEPREQQGKALTDTEQKQLLINTQPRIHPVKSTFKDELKIAHEEHEVLQETIQGVVEEIIKNNNLDLQVLKKAVMPMIDSILRNPDAFTWLTMIKHRDNYTYNHLVSSSIWAASFGRNLGLPIKDIQSVSMGALLSDIGKIKLPEKLIKKPEAYSKYEYALARTHVEFSIKLIKEIPGIKDDVVKMVATHHERYDGSGYPNGLVGNNIPLFGRMAGIIDCYDALISDRYHVGAISPHEAVKQLYDWSGREFQPELVEQFIQVVGVYPVGTLVELSDGRVGVVVAHQKARRLRPKIMLILNKSKEFFPRFNMLNLYSQTEDEDGNPLNIIKIVNPGSYGIDPQYFYL